ncbi:transmembrane protein 216 isoform X1 [Lonchura striata]
MWFPEAPGCVRPPGVTAALLSLKPGSALRLAGGVRTGPFPCSGRHRSSAPLQVLLFLNGWYCATYFLLEAFVFVYKVLLLPYPVYNLVLDVVLLLLYLGIEATRIFFGSKGNLCQRKVPLSLSLALTVPAAVLAVYYLLLQTYSLRLEAFLSAILLLFYGLELLLGFLALLSFSSMDPY